MEVDAGLVAMDTNDDDSGFEGKGEAWGEESSNVTYQLKEFRDSPRGPAGHDAVEDIAQEGRRQLWDLPEGFCQKIVLQKGEGSCGPFFGSSCTVTVEVSSDTHDLELSQIGYPVGDGNLQIGEATTPISYLMDNVLMSMKRKETSEIIVSRLRDVNEKLIFHITLHDFKPATPPWRMVPLEKYSAAKVHKERGAQRFKEGNIYAAFAHFRTALRLLLSILPFSFMDDEMTEKSSQQLICQCYLNLAACQLKTGHHYHVVTNCTEALKISPSNVKALYRRASANISLENYLLAHEDLVKGLHIEPNNHVLAELLQTLNVRMAQSQAA